MICWIPHALWWLWIFMFWVSQVKTLLQAFPVSVFHQDVFICSSARVYWHASASQIRRKNIPEVSGKYLPGWNPALLSAVGPLDPFISTDRGTVLCGSTGVEGIQTYVKATSFPQTTIYPYYHHYLFKTVTKVASLRGPDHWMWCLLWTTV